MPEIIRPNEIFKNNSEVQAFARNIIFGKIETHIDNLKQLLLLCEEDELFEWCRIIKDEMDNLLKNKDKAILPKL